MTLLIDECDGPEPESVFATLHGRRRSFFLDSALPSETLSRYSIIGFEPVFTIEASGRTLTLSEGGKSTVVEGNPLEELRTRLATYRCEPHPDLPFVGGAVGYFSYDFGARWEIRTRAAATLDLPDFELGFYEGGLVYSHEKRRWFLVANSRDAESARCVLQRLREAFDAAKAPRAEATHSFHAQEPVACEDRRRYVEAVGRIKDYIRSGDVYQVNLAHKFEAVWEGTPFELYSRLRRRSPAPFASFVSTRQGHVISCSPERFVQLRSGNVETRPIKGTRPRGPSPGEDEQLAADLVGSAKERAELLMIVDLERNDLGRVCVPGTIRVTDLYRLEAHPTVFHLVGTVSGNLRLDCDAIDLLRAAFPGGSITGAPKIRAMQIIDELESSPRHVYTGSIGYLGFDGGCDLSIAIRTIVTQGRTASYHVGAGIVWDSDPESEYEETLAKGKALFEALSASGGFGS